MMNQETHERTRRVCVLGLGGGGFHLESECLLAKIPANIELVLIYAIASQTTENWSCQHPVHRAFVVRSHSLFHDRLWQQIVLTFLGFFKAFWILLATRSDCILAVGTAQAIPFGLASRLLGIPMIFIESITRINSPSQ